LKVDRVGAFVGGAHERAAQTSTGNSSSDLSPMATPARPYRRPPAFKRVASTTHSGAQKGIGRPVVGSGLNTGIAGVVGAPIGLHNGALGEDPLEHWARRDTGADSYGHEMGGRAHRNQALHRTRQARRAARDHRRGHPAATVDVLGETPFSRAGALGPVGRRARRPAYFLPHCSP
jgi:hypothetical protein